MNNKNLVIPPAKKGGWKCPYCNVVTRTRKDLNIHKKDCHYKTNKHDFLIEKRTQSNMLEANCTFCGRSFTTKSGKTFHEKYCLLNPSRINYEGHKVSDSTKEKIRKNANRNPKKGAGRGIKGWYKGLYCMSTWELAWVVYQIEHGKVVEQCKKNLSM